MFKCRFMMMSLMITLIFLTTLFSLKLSKADPDPRIQEITSLWKARKIGVTTWTALTENTKSSEFARDINMVYRTIFPENANFNSKQIVLSPKVTVTLDTENTVVINSFKKLVVMYSQNGILYSTEKNTISNETDATKLAQSKWKYPLASVFTHGGRTLLVCKNPADKSFGADHVLNLVFGTNANDKTTRTKKLFKRSMASHSVSYSSGKITENKIVATAIFQLNTHKGFNIPFGGFGNQWPIANKFIGNDGEGVSLSASGALQATGSQAGHLYLKKETFKDAPVSVVMIGLESEAPGSQGMFSTEKHSALSALAKANEKPAVNGGAKWVMIKDIGGDFPSEYGGRIVKVPADVNNSLYEKINTLNESAQKLVYWILLSSNNEQTENFISNYFNVANYKVKLEALSGEMRK